MSDIDRLKSDVRQLLNRVRKLSSMGIVCPFPTTCTQLHDFANNSRAVYDTQYITDRMSDLTAWLIEVVPSGQK